MNEQTNYLALPMGHRLQEYEILRELGTGGFGITYQARDRSLDRLVVIKENLPSMFAYRDSQSLRVAPSSNSPETGDVFRWSIQNFLQEARMLARFDHPNIVPVFRVFESHGTAYFVMPYLGDRSLEQEIVQRSSESRPFSEDELRDLLRPLLDGLSELHRQAVYHRDIKPANILMLDSGTPVLIDFGTARQQLGEKTLTVFETAGYTPFEQMRRDGEIGPWSDIYALAGSFYKLMAFETPPRSTDRVGNDPVPALFARLRDRGVYSEDLISAIERGFAFDRADRPQAVSAWIATMRFLTPAGPGSEATEASEPALSSVTELFEQNRKPVSGATGEGWRITHPSYGLALVCHLLGGFGLFYADPGAKRKWLHVLFPLYAVADILLAANGVAPFDTEFGSTTFLIAIGLWLLSFVDVFLACRKRRRES